MPWQAPDGVGQVGAALRVERDDRAWVALDKQPQQRRLAAAWGATHVAVMVQRREIQACRAERRPIPNPHAVTLVSNAGARSPMHNPTRRRRRHDEEEQLRQLRPRGEKVAQIRFSVRLTR